MNIVIQKSIQYIALTLIQLIDLHALLASMNIVMQRLFSIFCPNFNSTLRPTLL